MVEAKMCVVGLIGKSQLLQNQSKAWKLNSLLQKDYFKSGNFSSDHQNSSTENDFNIQTNTDYRNKVIYIHLESIYDSNYILDSFLKMSSADSESDSKSNFFELWEKENSKYVKSILLLFSVVHIILISNPSCEFEIGYIRFFRIVDTLRNKLLPTIVDHLKSLNLPISKDWIYAGRPCSPRVLFTFENCPAEILNDRKSIEKLQISLEDQIYNSLRKSYVITNISNNSLFAIPANQKFVYIHRQTCKSVNNTNIFLQAVLLKECSKETPGQYKLQQQRGLFSNNFLSDTMVNTEELDTDLFRKFVFDHINTALTEGFNDNVGRTNVYPVFELVKPAIWDKIFDCLEDLFLGDPKTQKVASQFTQLNAQIEIDSQFSENRCKKQLPLALSIYQESLPGHYTKSQHLIRLDKAIQYFNVHGRGLLFNTYLKQLTAECEQIWQSRQLCEAVSLNGHACIFELHRISTYLGSLTDSGGLDAEISDIDEKSENEKSENDIRVVNEKFYGNKSRSRSIRSDSNKRDTSQKKPADRLLSSSSCFSVNKRVLPVKSHNSNIITIAASNCGEFQMERKDPFDLIEANCTFYEDFTPMLVAAKKKQIKYEFQVSDSVINTDESQQAVLTNHQGDHSLITTQPFVYSDPNMGFNLSQDDQFPKLSKNPLSLNQLQTFESSSRKTNEQSLLFHSPLTASINKNTSRNFYMNILTTPNEETISSSNLNNQIIKNQSISPIRSNNFTDTLMNAESVIANNSQTIYLAGMTHSENPPGLTPRFSSWSLISIGKNSHYNPHTGLNQPGFLPNHNFLIPWDIVINKGQSINQAPDKQSQQQRGNRNGHSSFKKKTSEPAGLWSTDVNTTSSSSGSANSSISIRAYIGMEYECPCGHRFICSGPDRIVKVSTQGTVKDDAYKLLNGDMPLYTACPCRNSKDTTPYMAQMMRIYIVTPVSQIQQSEASNIDYKSSLLSTSPGSQPMKMTSGTAINRLHILLRPRVQPNPTPCPIFWPSNNKKSICLAENSIWVLRLPYIYMGDNHVPYYRPKDFETLNNCRVLKGTFSVVLNNNDQ